MGRWLAEFQENTLETGIQTTDTTDTSHDLSVLSVPNQGVLTEIDNIADEVISLIQQSCEGLAITPYQFIALTTKEDREHILSGDLPLKVLRAYAMSFAKGIQTGRITFHPKLNHGI